MSDPVRAWYAQIAEAAKTPGLAQHLVRRTGELFPRFADLYDKIRALPRRLRRAIGRARGWSLARVAMLLALTGGSVNAALITVDETTCRFVDAVVAANTDSAQGGCTAGSGEDFLLLESNVTLDMGRSVVVLSSPMTIQAGQGTVIDGSGEHCLLVTEPGVANLAGVTIRNCGGGAYTPNYGGGVYNRGALTLDAVTIDGCIARYGGGGVWNYRGTVTILGSTIVGNTALGEDFGSRYGGGVGNWRGDLTITESTVSGNIAIADAGGVFSTYGTAKITGSTISGNATYGLAGGVNSEGGSITIENSTISGNDNAGLYCGHDEVTVRTTTITGNTWKGIGQFGGSLVLENSLIAGNAIEVGVASYIPVTESFNLFGTNGDAGVEGFTPGPTDVVPAAGVGLEDILLPLADNGGPTETHALVRDGPAIDVIPASDSLCAGTFDQRGVPRPVGPGCDTGSFELEAAHVALGGSVTGLAPKKVICSNPTTGEREQSKTSESSWNCEALGLSVSTGDKVQTTASGVATSSAVGGSVTRMTPSSVTCENVTTGLRVKKRTGATTWDCQALGLAVTPGDTVTTGASGTAD